MASTVVTLIFLALAVAAIVMAQRRSARQRAAHEARLRSLAQLTLNSARKKQAAPPPSAPAATAATAAPPPREERECPFCAEPILKKARVCKHCGRDVEPMGKQD